MLPPLLNNFQFTSAHTDKEEKDTNGWYLNVLNGVAILILIIAIGLLVIWCRRRSGKKDTATAKGDEEAELEVVVRPKVPVDSEDKCTTAPQNDRVSSRSCGRSVNERLPYTLTMFSGFRVSRL